MILSPLNSLLASPLIGMLGTILLHSLWQGAALLLALRILLWILPTTAPGVRYGVTFTALLLCLVVPVATYALPTFRLTGESPLLVQSPATPRAELVSRPPVPAAEWTGLTLQSTPVLKTSLRAVSAHAPLNWRAVLMHTLPWAVLLWFNGVLLMTLRLVLGLRATYKLRTRFVTPVSKELQASFASLKARLGFTGQVRVGASRVADVPMVVGFFKPLVLFPASMLSGLTAAQLEMILAHELAHVKRLDPLANLVQTLVETLLFFNPAALWISSRVRQERECCCDALAITLCGGNKVKYAKALATLNGLRLASRLQLAADGGSLLERIRRLTGSPTREDLTPAHSLGAVLLVVLPLLVVSFVSAQSQGGTLRIAYSSIQQLDPYKSAGGDEINAFSQVFDPLISFSEEDYRPVPHLAESWEATDETTWVFKLREGVTFQDGNDIFPEGEGRELTADDVVYSVERYLEVSTTFTLGDIESVRAIDPYTVEFKTAAPDPFFVTDPNRLGRVMIVPREAIEQLGEEEFARNPIGSGPFELTSFTPDQSLEFSKNEDYWLPTNLDGVEFVFIPDPTVQTIALESGDVDVIPYIFNVDSVAQLSENPDLTLLEGFGSYRGIGFNVTTPPFDEFAVRDAISKAIDIDGAVAAVVGQFGMRAYGQVAPWTGFETDPGLQDLWSYDPEAAVAELAEAGFTDSDGDGVLDRDGQPLSFSVKTIAGSHVRVLTILVTQLQELGIDAKLLQQDAAVWGDDLQQGNDTGMFFDYSFSGITGLYSLFHSSNNGRSNTHFYDNPEVDILLDQASETIEFEARNDLWLEAQRIIMQDRAGIPLYFENGYAIVSNRVQDFAPGIAGLHLVSTENNVSLTEE
jgi:ABC-type transport system substrate-binding protein